MVKQRKKPGPKKTAAKAPEKAPAKAPEMAKPSDLVQHISKSKLLVLMRSAKSARNDITEISGGLGSEIKSAVENNHLDRKVFRLMVQLDRMEPEKLREFLDTTEYYLDISGLKERAESVNPMQFEPGDEESSDETEDEAETAEKPSNVQPLRAAE